MLRLLAGWGAAGAPHCGAWAGAALAGAAAGRRHAHSPAPPTAPAPARGLHLAPPFLVEDYVPAAVTTHRLGWTKVGAAGAASLRRAQPARSRPARQQP
jgi:hypothetical protein